MRAAPACALTLVALSAACGPVTVEQAEADCFRTAQLASHPRGTVALGLGSGGAGHAAGRGARRGS